MQVIFEPSTANSDISDYAKEAEKLLSTNRSEIIVNDKELLVQISSLCTANPNKYKDIYFSLKRGKSLITFSNPLALIANLYLSSKH